MSSEQNEVLLQFKKILTTSEIQSILRMPTRNPGEFFDPPKTDPTIMGFTSNCVTTSTHSKDYDARSRETSIMSTKIVSSDIDDVSFTKEIDDYLMRECCTNKFLAEDGKCLVNECHKRWLGYTLHC